MRIAVVGSGYVGLVAGVCFADTGNDVVCIDIDEKKVAQLREGKPHFYEPGLSDLMKRNIAEGRLTFATETTEGCMDAEVVFLAVGTPSDDNGAADLKYVFEAARQVGLAAEKTGKGKIVVNKSTVPVGTNGKVREVLASTTQVACTVVSNPEFLKEGAAIQDFLKPDRVVIGTEDAHARKVMGELYAPFVRTGNPILYMDPASAEMTKYAANSLLAVRISFMNEVARLCEKVGADVDQVRKGAGSDRRIGYAFLFPGCGFGGSCFPKDIRALANTGREFDQTMQLVEAAHRVNELQRESPADKILAHFGEDLSGKRFALWGLAFKPRTDDVREAPALFVIDKLLKAGASICAHDPQAKETAQEEIGDRIDYVDRPYDALKEADALIVCTEWNEYRHPDFDVIKRELREPVIVDGRNIYDLERMREDGFTYYGIGRRS